MNCLHGFVTGEDLVRSMEAIAADERFDNLRFVISDRREMVGNSIGPEHLESAAAIRFGSAHTNPNIVVLVVTAKADALRVNELMTERPLIGSHPTLAFPDMETARTWLARHLA
jgi:hypothetical protein